MAGLVLGWGQADAQVATALPESSREGVLRLDTVFLVLCGALVLFMQAGFAMLEVGSVRAKNSLNVLTKTGADFCLGTLCFLMIGFSVMFGATWNGLIGGDFLWLSARDQSSEVWAFVLFQTLIAGVATTIATLPMGERTRYRGYLAFTIVFACLIYPLVGHWSWGHLAPGISEGSGWLQARGFQDFAGACVVHVCGGAAALAGLIVVGPRKGRFSQRGTPLFIPPHNLPLSSLGTLVLIFGWFGLTCGSLLEAQFSIGRIGVNTLASASSAGFVAMMGYWSREGRAEPSTLFQGMLGGLVAISAAAPLVTPAQSIAIGAVAGLLVIIGANVLLRYKIDDVVNAVPVHLLNGLWGSLALALFGEGGFSVRGLSVQITGGFFTAVASFGLSIGAFYLIHRTIGLRVTEDEEEDGLDYTEHASNAYPDFNSFPD